MLSFVQKFSKNSKSVINLNSKNFLKLDPNEIFTDLSLQQSAWRQRWGPPPATPSSSSSDPVSNPTSSALARTRQPPL